MVEKPNISPDNPKRIKIKKLILTGVLAIGALTSAKIGSELHKNKYLPELDPHPKIETLVRANEFDQVAQTCMTDDRIYRINNRYPAHSYQPLKDADFKKLESAVTFNESYDAKKLRVIIDDLQATTGVNIQLKFDAKNEKIPVQKVVEQLFTFKTVLISNGQKGLIKDFILYNGKIANNESVRGRFIQYNSGPAVELNLKDISFQEGQTILTHELNHFGANTNYDSGRLCKIYFDLKTAGLDNDQIEIFFEKIKAIEENPSDMASKIKQYLINNPDSESLTFSDATADFEFIYEQFLKKELLGNKEFNHRNYYFLHSLRDLTSSISKDVYRQLSKEEKTKLKIKNSPNYSERSKKDTIFDLAKNDEIIAVPTEMQTTFPVANKDTVSIDTNYANYIDSLIVTGGRFNRSVYFSPEYFKLKLEYSRLVGLISASEAEYRAKYQDQLWNITKKMEVLTKQDQTEFSISEFFKVRPQLLSIMKREGELLPFKNNNLDISIAQVNVNSINKATEESLQRNTKKEDQQQVKNSIIQFQQEHGIVINILDGGIKQPNTFTLLDIKIIMNNLRSQELFYKPLNQGGIYNVHLNKTSSQSYKFQHNKKDVIGVFYDFDYASAVSENINLEKEREEVKTLNNKKPLSQVLRFIQNYDSSKPIDIQISELDSSSNASDSSLISLYERNQFQYEYGYEKDKPETFVFASLIQASENDNANLFDPQYVRLRNEYTQLTYKLDNPKSNLTSIQKNELTTQISAKLDQIEQWNKKTKKPFTPESIKRSFEINIKIVIDVNSK
ncbi:MAG: hypothetical protein ACRCXZ_09175 [Patescibacteria group bacterium]